MIATAPLSNRPILPYSAVEQLFFFQCDAVQCHSCADRCDMEQKSKAGNGSSMDLAKNRMQNRMPHFFSCKKIAYIIIIFPNTIVFQPF